jgi:hypothetical protein
MSRNLVEYPITIDEVWETMQEVRRLYYDHNKSAVGGQQEYILARINDLIDERFTPEDFRIWK